MVDLTAIHVDGYRGVTISAFDVRFVSLPTMLRGVRRVIGERLRPEDIVHAPSRVPANFYARVSLENEQGSGLGYLVCQSLLMLSHSEPHSFRVAFNNEELRQRHSTRVIFSWKEAAGQVFELPDDDSLYS